MGCARRRHPRLDVILVKEFDFVQNGSRTRIGSSNGQLWDVVAAQVAEHLNSIVAFFMRFLFLFNLLVPFFRPLCSFSFMSFTRMHD